VCNVAHSFFCQSWIARGWRDARITGLCRSDEDHFVGFEPLICREDEEAAKARQLVDGHDVELGAANGL
jgi:hypothetical protein